MLAVILIEVFRLAVRLTSIFMPVDDRFMTFKASKLNLIIAYSFRRSPVSKLRL